MPPPGVAETAHEFRHGLDCPMWKRCASSPTSMASAHEDNNIPDSKTGSRSLESGVVRPAVPSSPTRNCLLGDADRPLPRSPVGAGRPGRSTDVLTIAGVADLTNQLLTFSRQQVVSGEPVDLNEVGSLMEPMLARLIGERIELRVSLCAGTRPAASQFRCDNARHPAVHPKRPRCGATRGGMPRAGRGRGGRRSWSVRRVRSDRCLPAACPTGRSRSCPRRL